MIIALCLADEKTKKDVVKKIHDISKKDNIQIGSINTYKSAESLLFNIGDDFNKVNLIIMDTKLMEEDGVEEAKKFREEGYDNEIVFLTDDPSKVFDSFDAMPLHYILHANFEKLRAAVRRAYKKTEYKKEEIISISCAGETRNIPLREIYYFQSDKRTLEVHYGKNQFFRFYARMGKTEELLFTKGFVRVHKGYLVSISKVRAFDREKVEMMNGETVPMGRIFFKKNHELLSSGMVI